MELNLNEILLDVKNQLQENDNGFGEPQVWIYLNENDRSIEITHEKNGLPKDKEFYSLRLHCSEEEFDNDDFHSTIGVIETYNTNVISDEQLKNGIAYLMKINLDC